MDYLAEAVLVAGLAGEETDIVKDEYVAVLHLLYGFLGFCPYDVRYEEHIMADLVVQEPRLLLQADEIIMAFAPLVRENDYASAPLAELLYRDRMRIDTRASGNLPVLDRGIEVHPHDYLLPFDIHIADFPHADHIG